MKKTLIFIYFCSIISASLSQVSLNKDSVNGLLNSYINSNNDSLSIIYNEIIEYGHKNKDYDILIGANKTINRSEADSATKSFYLNELMRLKINFVKPIDFYQYYMFIQFINMKKGDYASAAEYLDSSRNMALKMNDSTKLFYVSRSFSSIVAVQGNFQEALNEMKMGISYLGNNANASDKLQGYNHLINIANQVNADTAYYYITKAINFIEKEQALNNPEHSSIVNQTYLFQSIYFFESNKYKEAITSLNKVVNYYEDNGQKFTYYNGEANWILSHCHYGLEDYKEAKRILLEAKIISDSVKHDHLRAKTNQSLLVMVLRENPIEGIDPDVFLNDLDFFSNKNNEETNRLIADYKVKYETQNAKEQLLVSEKEAAENALIATRNLSYFLYAIFGAILLIVLGGGFYYWKQQKNARKIDELNKKALQLQMNPHFFFNVLNSINSFIVKNDKKEAQQYLSKFSRLMRLTLENAQENLIPIEKEIELVENYLALEQLRTKNFNYTIDVDESIKDKKIPPLMIQPFVENSIVHAFRDMDRQGEIEVSLKQINDTITIKISDDGKGIDTSVTKINPEKSSLALKITRERLNAMFKHKEEIIFDALRIENKEYPGTLVKFRIPVIA